MGTVYQRYLLQYISVLFYAILEVGRESEEYLLSRSMSCPGYLLTSWAVLFCTAKKSATS